MRTPMLLLALAGCGAGAGAGAPTPPPKTTPPVDVAATTATTATSEAKPPAPHPIGWLTKPACEVRPKFTGAVPKTLVLRAEGAPFAATKIFDGATLALAPGEAGGTATVDAFRLHVAGDVKLADLVLFIDSPALIDGWLDVKFVRPASVEQGAVRAPIVYPNGFTPSSPREGVFSCAHLAFGPPYRKTLEKTAGLKEGVSIAVRAAPGGDVIGTVALPVRDPNATIVVKRAPLEAPELEVFVLEKKGAEARVRLEGPAAAVEGWIDTKMLTKASASPLAFGGEPIGYYPLMGGEHCPFEVKVYVRVRGEAVPVGVFLPDAPIRVLDWNAQGTGPRDGAEVRVDLGLEDFDERDKRGALQPFVLGPSLRGCSFK